MKARQWIALIGLLVLVVATAIGLFLTQSVQTVLPVRKKSAAQAAPAVDQTPLQTARKLALLASTPEEQDFAHEASRLADYEVDLAFADALREATEHPPAPTPEQRELRARAGKADAVVKTDKDLITRLTRQLATASESAKEDFSDQLEVAKAQLELDQDELDDAKEDLARAGGNPQAKIQRLLQEHEAASHNDRAASSGAITPENTDYQSHNLAPQIRAWIALQQKRTLLAQARQAALDDVPVLTR